MTLIKVQIINDSEKEYLHTKQSYKREYFKLKVLRLRDIKYHFHIIVNVNQSNGKKKHIEI